MSGKQNKSDSVSGKTVVDVLSSVFKKGSEVLKDTIESERINLYKKEINALKQKYDKIKNENIDLRKNVEKTIEHLEEQNQETHDLINELKAFIE
jgi:cell division protein FtsB